MFCLKVKESVASCLLKMCEKGIVRGKHNFESGVDVDFVVALMESNNKSIRVLNARIVSEFYSNIYKQWALSGCLS